MCCACGALTLALALLGVGSARAQDAIETTDVNAASTIEASIDARARDLFDRARGAFDAGRFPEARELLEESLRLAPRAPTALNLARVKRSMGELLGAEQTLEAMLAGEYGGLEGERRSAVASLLDEVRREIAVLSIAIGGRARATIAIDGIEAGVARRGEQLEVRVNPAAHAISASTSDGSRARVSVTLGPGERRAVSLTLAGATDADVSTSDDDDGVLASPWFWIATCLVVAGGAAVAIVLATEGRTAEPVTDPIFPIAEALRF